MSTQALEAKQRKLLSMYKKGTLKYKTRLYNRCSISGRSKSFISYFGLSRNMFRDLARAGMLPGVKKASW